DYYCEVYDYSTDILF
nr:immunoglobulin light chain junction region [Macaca mulatta]